MRFRIAWLAPALALLLWTPPADAEFKLTVEDRVVLFGDTAVSEIRTLDWVLQFVRTRYPERTPLICSLGMPRCSPAQANARLDRELLPLQPTRVLLCFGLEGQERRTHDDAILAGHIAELRRLVATLRERNIRVDLITPPPPDESQSRALQNIKYRETIDKYAEAIRELAKTVDAPLIDWHRAVNERMEKHASATKPPWAQYGVVPSWYSLAILTDLLLEHWGAEPLDYRITADWNSDAVSATIGSARIAERDENHMVLALQNVPVVINMLGGQDMEPADWPLSRWFEYRLTVENLPGPSYVLSESGNNAKPFLRDQLQAGANVAMFGPLANHAATRALHEAILRVCNQFIQYRLACERVAPEPELEEGFELLRKAEASLALGANRIAQRTPSRFNCDLRIEAGTIAEPEAPKTPPAKQPNPRRTRPNTPNRAPQGNN